MIYNEETVQEVKIEEKAPVAAATEKKSFFEKAAFTLLLVFTFLFPLFFLANATFEFGKSIFLSVVTLLCFICYAISALQKGKISYPKSFLSLAALLLPLSFLVSALFGGEIATSILGGGFEIGTFVFVLLSALVLFLTAELLNTKTRMFYFYLTFFASFFLLALYQILRLIDPGFLTFGVFTTPSFNLIGKWNELGLFFGLTAIVSLITIEAFLKNKIFKYLGIAMLAVSLFFLALVHFLSIWFVVGLFALLSGSYIFAFRKNPFQGEGIDMEVKTKRRIPLPAVFVLAVSLVFIFWGTQLNGLLTKNLHISEIEVRPSWESTIDIAKLVLASDPILGSGPNRFVDNWLNYKPDGINTTIFWNTDFSFGVGLIPTYIIETGLLGALVWIFFFLAFLKLGMRAIFYPTRDALSRYLVLSSFFGAMYLWIYQVIYVPSHVMVVMPFLFTGVFLAAVSDVKIIEKKVVPYTLDPRKSFVSVLLIVIAIAGAITLGYFFSQRFISAVYARNGVAAQNQNGDSAKAEEYLLRAIRIYPSDEYYRVLTQLYVYQMNQILNDTALSQDLMKSKFEAILPKAIESAKNAVAVNTKNYQNYVALGAVYESILSLGDKDAYGPAKDAYASAQKLNPSSPAILLLEARLEAVHNNLDGAKDIILQALKLKNNYTEAIYLLSQIEISKNNVKGAIQAVEAVAYLNPDNPVVFFQLGFLRYSDKDYDGARQALEQAVILNKDYSNARYFLGLSLERLGRREDAILQFVEIEKLNPDSAEVKLILTNLRAGKSPFTDAKPPVDDKPEKRSKLPVTEKTE